jgi:hypothetical protein
MWAEILGVTKAITLTYSDRYREHYISSS